MRCLFGFAMLILGVFLLVQFAHADVRRWNADKEKVQRAAVERIDMGDFAGPEGENGKAYGMFHWVLACVDGVKVYTTYSGKNEGGVHSIVLPGKCDGTYAKPASIGLPQNFTEEKAQKSGLKVDW